MIRTLTLAAVAIAASACHMGADAEERDPGTSVSRSYQIGAFDRIEVAGPYEVKVATGGTPGASATGGEKLLDETEVVVEGNVLKIRPKKRTGIHWGWSKRGKAEFTVTTAMLHGAEDRRFGRHCDRQGGWRFQGRGGRIGRPQTGCGARRSGRAVDCRIGRNQRRRHRFVDQGRYRWIG